MRLCWHVEKNPKGWNSCHIHGIGSAWSLWWAYNVAGKVKMWRWEESTMLQVTLVCMARIQYKKGHTFCGEAPSTFLSFPVVFHCFQKDSKSNHTYSHFYYPLLCAPSHTLFSGKSSSKSYQVWAEFIECSMCNDRWLRCSVIGENKDAASATNHL